MNRDDFEFEVRHVGINCENEEEADAAAQRFEDLFGFTKKVGNSSIFCRNRSRSNEKEIHWKERTCCSCNE